MGQLFLFSFKNSKSVKMKKYLLKKRSHHSFAKPRLCKIKPETLQYEFILALDKERGCS